MSFGIHFENLPDSNISNGFNIWTISDVDDAVK